MSFGWKVLIPLGLVWVLATGAIIILPDVYGRTRFFQWAAVGAGIVLLLTLAAPAFSRKPKDVSPPSERSLTP
jgi:NADH-quinone oxidoreductase subunit H